MSRISAKDTKPELIIRSLLYKMGYRFRLHKKDLPGKPDIALPKHKKIIFVHGCFWHSHKDCPRAKRPTTNKEFWHKKLDRTIERDKTNIYKLQELGWDVFTIWTCEIKDLERLKSRLLSFMEKH